MKPVEKFLHSHLSSVAAVGLAAALAAAASPALADPITILDPSFEAPAQAAPGEFSGPIGPITDWTVTTFGTGATAGVWYLPDAPYLTVNAPDGNQVAYIYSGTGTTGGGAISQTTSTLFQAGTNYTLTFDVGELALAGGLTYPGTVDAILYEGSGSNVLASFAVAAPSSGPDSFQQDVFTLPAEANPYPSGDIGIEFSSSGGSGAFVTFDDVSLDATPVPEPASLPLLAAGLLGFAMLRRRANAPA